MLARQCSWCKVALGVDFPPEFEGHTVVSHGICKPCTMRFRAERVAGSTRIPPDLATEVLRDCP